MSAPSKQVWKPTQKVSQETTEQQMEPPVQRQENTEAPSRPKNPRRRKNKNPSIESTNNSINDAAEVKQPSRKPQNRNRRRNTSKEQTTLEDSQMELSTTSSSSKPLPTSNDTKMNPRASVFVPKSDSKPKSRKSSHPKGKKENWEAKKVKGVKEKKQSKKETPQVQQSVLATDIIERLNSDSYECIICSDVIKRHVTVWNCTNCFMIFHLFCIKKWSKASDEGTPSWRCPGCQFVSLKRPTPKCFCGKTTDPQPNPYLIPHSCGENCGKKRKNSDCPHPCTLMCHPGHCPPCAALGSPKTCYCGKESYRLRCGEKDPGKSCEKPCGKLLNCKRHRCQEACHSGLCGTCPKTETQNCHCGDSRESKPCGSGTLDTSDGRRHFSCGKACPQTLPCGNHPCPRTCHSGPCGSCELLPSKVMMCPCGKIPLPLISSTFRTSCTDPIPTCPNVCGKTLECGHTCPDTCHNGACLPCQTTVKVFCRCHSTSTSAVCCESKAFSQTFRCQKMCKTPKNCQRHSCRELCCPSAPLADPQDIDDLGLHLCSLPCGRKLKCGKHLCDLLCHEGRCPPCHATSHEAYVCECGKTKVEPPILCSMKLPACPHSCVRERSCGHLDGHTCHSRDKKCPPCSALVDRMCAGEHEVKKNVQCSQRHVTCGKQCGKALGCGNHLCRRVCHAGICQSTIDPLRSLGMVEVEPVTEGKSCGRICEVPRELCSHLCPSKCHPGQPCPKIPCKKKVTVHCSCKRRTMEMECLRGGPNDEASKPPRELPCDEQCALEARRRQLEDAFGPPPSTGTAFPDLLIQLGKASPHLVSQIEKRFEEIVQGISPKFHFGPMNRVQRRIVHELAVAYHIETESLDKEPLRSVVASRRKDSKIPQPLLSELLADRSKLQAAIHQTAPSPTWALLISDLTLEIKSKHILSYLQPLEGYFQLKWLDDNSALLLFKDSVRMRSALYLLTGRFNVQEYKDKLDSLDVSEPRKPYRKPAAPIPEYLPPEPVQESNYFSALKEGKPATGSTAWGDEDEFSPVQEMTTLVSEIPTPALQVPSEGEAPLESWEDMDDPDSNDPDIALAIRLSLEESQKQNESVNKE